MGNTLAKKQNAEISDYAYFASGSIFILEFQWTYERCICQNFVY